VQARGATLVPVLALRGLSGEMLAAASLAGTTEVWLRFPGGAREELICAASLAVYLCTPDASAAYQNAIADLRALPADQTTPSSARRCTSLGVIPSRLVSSHSLSSPYPGAPRLVGPPIVAGVWDSFIGNS
jgi:hypothetical protein